jgi:hypothetical protein
MTGKGSKTKSIIRRNRYCFKWKRIWRLKFRSWNLHWKLGIGVGRIVKD